MKPMKTRMLATFFAFAIVFISELGCSGGESGRQESGDGPAFGTAPDKTEPKDRTLVLAAYTTPREAYEQAVIPAFKQHWKAIKGENVAFETSYLGSGAQSRAVVGGFEADVVALSLDPDVQRIAEAGLITRDWRAGPAGGMVSRSIVVIGVRDGNPKGIKDWDDLGRTGLNVLTPNVKTSGGAMWNVAAIWGAALRGHTRAAKDDPAAAQTLLAGILANVSIMDKGARESILTFEKGVGDAAITYENEMLVSRKSGKKGQYVVPASTLLIENPIAVVDKYAAKHGAQNLAEAFVAFTQQPDIQRRFVEYGLRPIDASQSADLLAAYPPVTDLFTIRDLGGWDKTIADLFAAGGRYDQAMDAAAKRAK